MKNIICAFVYFVYLFVCGVREEKILCVAFVCEMYKIYLFLKERYNMKHVFAVCAGEIEVFTRALSGLQRP